MQRVRLVLHARGAKKNTFAMTAPIYVSVEGERFWRRTELPSIAQRMKSQMQELLPSDPQETDRTEAFETQDDFSSQFKSQRDLLKARIDQANSIYDDLAERAGFAQQ